MPSQALGTGDGSCSSDGVAPLVPWSWSGLSVPAAPSRGYQRGKPPRIGRTPVVSPSRVPHPKQKTCRGQRGYRCVGSPQFQHPPKGGLGRCSVRRADRERERSGGAASVCVNRCTLAALTSCDSTPRVWTATSRPSVHSGRGNVRVSAAASITRRVGPGIVCTLASATFVRGSAFHNAMTGRVPSGPPWSWTRAPASAWLCLVLGVAPERRRLA